ncbi:MAG: hypothetical protein ACE5Q6_04815, partial [Dehalococcoidia bacterium]
THYVRSGSVQYTVQPARVQEHFATFWHQVGLGIQPGTGDAFHSCPFHVEQNPSMHIDAQRCICFCFSPECPGHHGGGVRELEAMAGPLNFGSLPPGLVFHVPPQDDAADVDPVLEELKMRGRELFPIPEGQRPKVISRLCAFTEDPSRVIRHQVISNTWNNPVNRALKKRQLWVHLSHLFALDSVEVLYGISISPEDWTPRKREALAAQVQRRDGNYAAFDDRAIAGVVRFLTSVPISEAVAVEDIDAALFEALRTWICPKVPSSRGCTWSGCPRVGRFPPTSPKAR